ncbi:MAG: hypothetical protein ACOX0A_04305 [Thermoguttaceae bacterium]|jgi:hypothetical protein
MRADFRNRNCRGFCSGCFADRRSVLKGMIASALALCGDYVWSFESGETELAKATRESLDALARRQNVETLDKNGEPERRSFASAGSFGSGTELFGRDPGVAALCGLAFLASGSLPGRGRYGRELERVIDYLLACAHNDKDAPETYGLIADLSGKGRKPTYSHGFATLFLSAIDRAETRDAAKAAVEFLVHTQNSEGGWRYEPKRVAVADLSVTTCQLSALRAARDAGIHVPAETIADAERYIVSLQNDDGGFRYLTLAGPSGYSRTSAAIHALQASGERYSRAIERGFEYLEKIYPLDTSGVDETKKIEYWAYGQFYAALAYWRGARDEETKSRAERFFERLTREALAKRGVDGLWRSSVSTEAETAFILCALLVPQEQTPFFLR